MASFKSILPIVALVLIAHCAMVSAHRHSKIHKLRAYKYEKLLDKSDIPVSKLFNHTCLVPTDSAYNFRVEWHRYRAAYQIRSWCLRPAGGLITWERLNRLKKGKNIKTKNAEGQSVIIFKTGSNKFTIKWYGKWPLRVTVYNLAVKAYTEISTGYANSPKAVFLVVNRIKPTTILRYWY